MKFLHHLECTKGIKYKNSELLVIKMILITFKTTFYIFVVIVVYFILRRLLYPAFSANLGLICMLHPGMGPLV